LLQTLYSGLLVASIVAPREPTAPIKALLKRSRRRGTTPAVGAADRRVSPPGAPRRRVGLFLGPLLFLFVIVAPAPEGMGVAAWRTAGIALLMATWWVTEALPLPVTALLPFVLLPIVGVTDPVTAASPYANPIIFLFLGGFMIALALERWDVHRRFAVLMLAKVGTRPTRIVAGFMATSALLSMWISNTATTLMMIPLAMSVLTLIPGIDRTGRLATVLVLGVAYGASVGGIGTLIGSPPNALYAGFLLESQGIRITFLQWMMVGLPLVIVGLPLAWFFLTHVAFPLPRENVTHDTSMLRNERAQMGRMGKAEKRVLIVFAVTATLWVVNPFFAPFLPFPLTDAAIGILGALALFLIPNGKDGSPLLDWQTASRLPWGILLLVGGGLSLAASIQRTGLASWLGDHMTFLGTLPLILLLLGIAVGVMLLSEMTSNTATAAAFLPVAAALAVLFGYDVALLALPVALGASAAFMLPVATPPNAIAYGTGRVSAGQMVRGGVFLSMTFAVLIMLAVRYWAPFVLGF
jgi:solute carrier family 13 (sodium-dependent dicarboxylate transporter), member 2/3/5